MFGTNGFVKASLVADPRRGNLSVGSRSHRFLTGTGADLQLLKAFGSASSEKNFCSNCQASPTSAIRGSGPIQCCQGLQRLCACEQMCAWSSVLQRSDEQLCLSLAVCSGKCCNLQARVVRSSSARKASVETDASLLASLSRGGKSLFKHLIDVDTSRLRLSASSFRRTWQARDGCLTHLGVLC